MQFKYVTLIIAAATSCSALVIPRQVSDQSLTNCLTELATLKTSIEDMTKLVKNWGGSSDLLGAFNIQTAGTALDNQCKKTTEIILSSGPFVSEEASQAIVDATLILAPSSIDSLNALLERNGEFRNIHPMFGAIAMIRKQLAAQHETYVQFQDAVGTNVPESYHPLLAEAALSVNDKYEETQNAYAE